MSEEGERGTEEGDKPSEDKDRGCGVKTISGAHPGGSGDLLTQTSLHVGTPPTLMPAPPVQEGGRVCLQSVVGYSGSYQHNLAWHPLRGQQALAGNYI